LTYYPDVTSATTIGDVTLEHDAQINGQENLTVNGTVTVNHQITQSTDGSTLDHWQYFASPFSNTTAGSLLSTNVRVDIYLAEYDNSLSSNVNNAWNFISSTSAAISPGYGYAVTFVNDQTETGPTISGTDYNMSLTGTLINTSSNTSVTLNQGLTNWNLIGNPYLAPINWSDSYFDFSNIQGSAAYIYNPATGTNITLDGTAADQYIPAMQGFFVDAASAGSFDIELSARVNTAHSFYKSSKVEHQLHLQVIKDSLMDEAVVFLDALSENTFDRKDARKLLTNSQTPQIYTSSNDGEKLVFNHIQTLDEPLLLKIQTNRAGKYKLQLGELAGDFNDYHIELLDNRGAITQLDKEDYQFETEDGLKTHEFVLYFQLATSINEPNSYHTRVYTIDHSIVVNAQKELNGEVAVFSLTGQKLFQSNLNGTRFSIELNANPGVVIVQVIDKGTISNYKVSIN
jgi:hypothetical protein